MIRNLIHGAFRAYGGNSDHLTILIFGLLMVGVDAHPIFAAMYAVGAGTWICLESLDEWDLENW